MTTKLDELDTNQASEDELRAEILTEFKQVHKLAPADYTENCTNIVMSIISTEKLKLLDRLSSHQEDLFWWTGGEYDELEGIDMRAIAAERELLTRLEAEL